MTENPDEERALPSTDFCSRASFPGPALELATDKEMPVLTGYLAVFDQWAHVKSRVEGEFMERMSRSAFSKTLKENRASMRLLFHHGEDPQIGFKPIGTIEDLEIDQKGVRYRAELFDTPNLREIMPGLSKGQMGSSMTFRPNGGKDSIVYRPSRSEFNPEGIPEVTRNELRVLEFGPCMFPYYEGTTASVRSFTDEFVLARLGFTPAQIRDALSNDRAEATHSGGESRNVPLDSPVRNRFATREGYLEWLNTKASMSSAR